MYENYLIVRRKPCDAPSRSGDGCRTEVYPYDDPAPFLQSCVHAPLPIPAPVRAEPDPAHNGIIGWSACIVSRENALTVCGIPLRLFAYDVSSIVPDTAAAASSRTRSLPRQSPLSN